MKEIIETLKNQIKNGVQFDTISGATAEKLLKTVSELEAKLFPKKYKYLEIVEKGNKEVAERFDVSKDSDSEITKLKSGISANLNHMDFMIRTTESDVELKSKF